VIVISTFFGIVKEGEVAFSTTDPETKKVWVAHYILNYLHCGTEW
jgi:hypothetical protein